MLRIVGTLAGSARMTQQGRDPSIAVTAIGLGQLDDVGGQRRFVVSPFGRLALRGPMLAQRCAGPSLGDAELGFDVLHAGAATGGA